MEVKLNPTDLKILNILRAKERRFTEIAQYMEISTAGLAKALEKLVKLGYVERKQVNSGYPPPVYYRITKKGLEALKQGSTKIIEETLSLFSPILDEEDRKAVEELIQRLKKKYQL